MSTDTPTTIGERLALALKTEGRTPNAVEEELGMSRGHVGRIIRGQRWSETIDVDQAKRIAALLHVTPSWLILGDGPMKRDGRGTTAAEAAIVFARYAGAREDAIRLAWEKHRDREAEMTAWDWTHAIDEAASALKTMGVPRPEVVRKKHRQTRALVQRKKKLLAGSAANEAPNEVPVEAPVEVILKASGEKKRRR